MNNAVHTPCQLLESLNDEQKAAALYSGGPQLIIAGAGSGKTRVLMVKAVLLCTRFSVDPQHILCITFTNKAADEMKKRLASFNVTVTAKTFHAAAMSILNAHGGYLGLKRPIGVYDEQDQLELVKSCMDELHYDKKSINPGSVAEWVSRQKDELIEPDAEAVGTDRIYHSIYRLYQDKLTASNALDFGDLIMKAVALLKQYPDLCRHYREKYTHLLVDEYQDTNTAQAVLLKLLAGEGQNLCVVGDPDQSIYGWRGANLNNILYFEQSFPDVRIFKLERNYRSTDIILNATNALIKTNRNRRDKTLWTDLKGIHNVISYRVGSDRVEARQVCDLIEQHMENGTPLSEMAVFYRVHSLSRMMEEVMLERAIPYTIVGGLPFYQRKEIKDILCYLRVIVNPDDLIAWKRVLGVPKRGIGEKSIIKINEFAAENVIPFSDALIQCGSIPGVTAKARQGIASVVELVNSFKDEFQSQSWSAALEALLDQLCYQDYILQNDLPEKAETRLDNIEVFKDALSEYQKEHPDAALADYLENIALRSSIDDWDTASERVSLMSLHSAKGLEFNIVYLIGMEERMLPLIRDIENAEDIEEERRLCYVGMTRAREQLYLFSSNWRSGYGRDIFSKPSRFLMELDPQTLEIRDLAGDREYSQWNKSKGKQRFKRFVEDAVACDEQFADMIDEFAPGDRVYHYDLGSGVIMGGSGSGEKKKYIVLFDGESKPRVVFASYAGLSKMDD
ncbi:MAG: UvrD-helicase domain-containing protein [Candidatus Auribacterota bacterium]